MWGLRRTFNAEAQIKSLLQSVSVSFRMCRNTDEGNAECGQKADSVSVFNLKYNLTLNVPMQKCPYSLLSFFKTFSIGERDISLEEEWV